MICQACREAADRPQSIMRSLYAMVIEDGEFRASLLGEHHDCRGGSWCDCQHRVKPVAREVKG